MDRTDVTPPGRESQVKALKEKPGIDNPWAVAWTSYEKSDATYDGSTCPACKQIVPVDQDNKLETHLAIVKDMGASGLEPIGRADAAESSDLCPGGGSTRMDHIEQRGGKWVLLAKSSGKVLGTHATKAEAEEQERAVQASQHGEDKTDTRVRRFEHIDLSSELPPPVKTADGFWAVSGRVARTGVQEYRDSSGGVRRELRLPEDVAASLPSFALQPLTNDHPPVMVDPKNASRYVAGAVGDAKLDGGWVTAPLKIYTADAIAAVEAGRAQLSVGYSCRLDFEVGDWKGQKYDAIQRDIIVNHVALVDSARAGEQARLRLDAGDAISITCITAEMTGSNREANPMAKLKIGALEFEVSDPNAQAAYNDAMAAKDREIGAEKQRADTADKMTAEKQKQLDAVQGRLDGKLAEDKAPIRLYGHEIPVADAVDQAKMDAFALPIIEARASARAALLVEARRHLGANEKFDTYKGKDGKDMPAKSDTEIKRLVVVKLDASAKLEGRSEDYVQARYDAAVEAAAKKTPSSVDAARAGMGATPIVVEVTDATPTTDPDAARRAMIDRQLRANVNHPKHIDGKV